MNGFLNNLRGHISDLICAHQYLSRTSLTKSALLKVTTVTLCGQKKRLNLYWSASWGESSVHEVLKFTVWLDVLCAKSWVCEE